MRKRTIRPDGHVVYATLADFLSADSHPAGVLTVNVNGVPIDVKHDPAGHDTTTVFFHAALSGPAARLPIFSGGPMSEGLETNRVHVSDPSLLLHDELMLSWYAGNHRQPKLQYVIRAILQALIPEGQRVVTFGASGGGFAALYYAHQFDGATAIPVNPQTDVAKYLPPAVDRYTRLAWSMQGKDVIRDVPSLTNLVRMYSAPVKNRVFYIQNTNDKSHMVRHYAPFMASLHPSNEVHPVLFDGESGHKPPSQKFMRGVLESAIRGDASPTGGALEEFALQS